MWNEVAHNQAHAHILQLALVKLFGNASINVDAGVALLFLLRLMESASTEVSVSHGCDLLDLGVMPTMNAWSFRLNSRAIDTPMSVTETPRTWALDCRSPLPRIRLPLESITSTGLGPLVLLLVMISLVASTMLLIVVPIWFVALRHIGGDARKVSFGHTHGRFVFPSVEGQGQGAACPSWNAF